MVRPTRHVLFDSFRAARGELDYLFSSMKSEQHIRNAVRQYIVPSFSRQRHRSVAQRLGHSQERSLFRTNASIVLQEARRRGNYRVAAAALDAIFSEASSWSSPQLFEPTWIKDAVSSCRNAEELRVMEGLLRQHEQRLLASGSARCSEGFLVAAAFGRSRATERAARLGDDDAALEDGSQSGEDSPIISTSLQASDDKLGRSHLVESGDIDITVSEETRVSAALAQPPSSTDLAVTGGLGRETLWSSPEERAAASLRRLQRHQRNLTVSPNNSFTRFFLHQGLVRHEAELIELYQAMRARPLDVSFRVVGCGHFVGGASQWSTRFSPYSAAVHELLQHRRGVHSVPWLPPAMGAYTLDTRDSVPGDTVLANRQLLKSLHRERLIAFQSLSSMLPVYYLDPQPGECVLDMCASPGNKTSLILDCIHAGDNRDVVMVPSATRRATTGASDKGSRAFTGSGCVVANEAQAARVGDLKERLRDVSPEVVVTRGRGETFGQVGSSDHHGIGGEADNLLLADGGVFGEGVYDRVLVDAPCSGEGRMGRDSLSWRLWHPGRGVEFFPLQYALLQRAVRLCKTGGRVVYATCTLNPLENEAVVAAVLRAFGTAVELIPPPRPLPHPAGVQAEGDHEGSAPPLRLTPGLRSWDVPSSAGGFLRTFAEAQGQGENPERLRPDMFAPSSACVADRGSDIGEALHRCCRRVMPHLNGNADGFFVAVIEKRAAVPDRPGVSMALALPAAAPSPPHSASVGSRGENSVAAASLAVTLSGGSNMFNDRGFLRLPPSHHLVQKYLGCFFDEAPSHSSVSSTNAPALTARLPRKAECCSAQHFLQRHDWVAVWCEGEGLRLLTQTSLQLLRRHLVLPVPSPKTKPNGFGLGFACRPNEASETAAAPLTTSAQLLNAGVLVVTAEGDLTERGASLIRPNARSRVVSLPLPFAQLLLAHRTLEISAALHLMPDYVQEAERALGPQRGFLTTSLGNAERENDAAAGGAHTSTWYSEAVAALSASLGEEVGVAGNAIVVVSPVSTSPSGTLSWAAPLEHFAWPVRVEVLQRQSRHDVGVNSCGLVRLHLTLPETARHRTRALIGRLQSRAHLQRSIQDRLHTGSINDPSLVLSQRELHGTSMRASQRHALLRQPAAQEVNPRVKPAPVAGACGPETISAELTSSSLSSSSSPTCDVFEL